MKKEYIPMLTLIVGMLVAIYAIPTTVNVPDANDDPEKVRTWNLEQISVMGSRDVNLDEGQSAILAIWVVNHSSVADTQYDTNDSTTNAVNASNTVLAYAQATGFNEEMNHSTDADLLVYVRANKTHAADGDWFNDSWVMVNFTSTILGVPNGHNLSGIICHNNSGDAFIYMMFVFNGTDRGIWAKQSVINNYAMCGTGFQLSRNQVVDDITIKLLCYY